MEVHAQLLTTQKLFSPSPNLSSSPPNTLISPFDLALPGSLPVLNLACVEKALVAASVLKCSINDTSQFERKHYFYPDNPSGYQITQNRWPIASEGVLAFGENKETRVNRIQLETDTGKSKKAEIHGFYADDVEEDAVGTVDLDFNRAGSPLIEVVFEPDIVSPADASLAVLYLRNLLRHVSVCDGKFELGSIRCDLNVSVWHGEKDEPIPDIERLGNRVEVKNLNSLKSIVGAATYEFNRQKKLLASSPDTLIDQETRTYDKKKGVTIPMRRKESSVDYRFLPDPDLPPLILSKIPDFDVEEIVKSIPELPDEARERLAAQYKLSADVAAVLVADPAFIGFFDITVSTADSLTPSKKTPTLAANLITNVLFALLKENGEEEEGKVTPENVGEIVALLNEGKITKKMSKEILTILHSSEGEEGRAVSDVVEEHGFVVENDSEALVKICVDTITNPDFEKQLKQFKEGDEKKRGKMEKFFFGKVMAASRGMADAETLKEALGGALEKFV